MADDPLVCRIATEADREAICGDLSDGVYDGNDYLPARIDFYYQMQAAGIYHMILCCESDGTDVRRPLGLDVVCRYDGGESIMLQALRVKPSARGRGVAKALSLAAAELVETLENPKPRRMRIITTATNPSVGLFQKQGFVEVHRMGICGAEILASPAAGVLSPVTSSDGIEEVQRAADAVQCLPQGCNCPYLVFDWQVEPVSASNAARLQQQHAVRFYSAGRGETNNRSDEWALRQSLSLGALTTYVSGTKMYCTVYAGGHAPTFEAHVRHWVRKALKAGSVRNIVFFYDEFPEAGSDVERTVADALGGHEGGWISFFQTAGGVIVMEKALKERVC